MVAPSLLKEDLGHWVKMWLSPSWVGTNTCWSIFQLSR